MEKCLITKLHKCSPDNWTQGIQYYKRTTQFIQESSTSSYSDLNQINIQSGKMADNHLVKTTIYHRHCGFPQFSYISGYKYKIIYFQ